MALTFVQDLVKEKLVEDRWKESLLKWSSQEGDLKVKLFTASLFKVILEKGGFNGCFTVDSLTFSVGTGELLLQSLTASCVASQLEGINCQVHPIYTKEVPATAKE